MQVRRAQFAGVISVFALGLVLLVLASRKLARRSCRCSSVGALDRRHARSAGAELCAQFLCLLAPGSGNSDLLSMHAWRAVAPFDKRLPAKLRVRPDRARAVR